jgi:hypothetical protein
MGGPQPAPVVAGFVEDDRRTLAQAVEGDPGAIRRFHMTRHNSSHHPDRRGRPWRIIGGAVGSATRGAGINEREMRTPPVSCVTADRDAA